MAAEVINPESAIDLWYALIVAIPAIITAIGVFYGQAKARKRWDKHDSRSEELLFEVKNDHTSNLRDDITDLGEAIGDIKTVVNEGFLAVKKDITGIREEIRTERLERIEGDKRSE